MSRLKLQLRQVEMNGDVHKYIFRVTDPSTKKSYAIVAVDGDGDGKIDLDATQRRDYVTYVGNCGQSANHVTARDVSAIQDTITYFHQRRDVEIAHANFRYRWERTPAGMIATGLSLVASLASRASRIGALARTRIHSTHNDQVTKVSFYTIDGGVRVFIAGDNRDLLKRFDNLL